MDMSRLATEALQALANRFGGVDIQYRREGWNQHEGPNKFRATLIPSTNEDDAYRLQAFGYTALEAMAALTGQVTATDKLKERVRQEVRELTQTQVYVLDADGQIRPATPDDLT